MAIKELLCRYRMPTVSESVGAGRERKRQPISCGIALCASLILLLSIFPSACGLRVTESEESGSYFYRLIARYSHEGRPVDFDIVVACNIRVSKYRGGNSGFLAAVYPKFFVQKTYDNHEVMQVVPHACQGETNENGRVPKDLLPGAIWYDTPGDYRFGIAYVSEDAFDSPNGQLKFLGAEIHRATMADWEEFRKRHGDNEGMAKKYFDVPPTYFEHDVPFYGTNASFGYFGSCNGVARFKLSPEGRAVLRKYWPDNRPKYWRWDAKRGSPEKELFELEKHTPISENSHRYTDLQHSYGYKGLATRSGGGRLWSKTQRRFPTEYFPVRDDRGIPWIFTEKVAESNYLKKYVEVKNGPGSGFLYCYRTLGHGTHSLPGSLTLAIADYTNRPTRIYIDGELLETPRFSFNILMPRFYERDEYMYVNFYFGPG